MAASTSSPSNPYEPQLTDEQLAELDRPIGRTYTTEEVCEQLGIDFEQLGR